MVNTLNKKGVQTLLVYGAFDSGLDIINAHFGKMGARLSRFPKVRPAIFDDIDHALFSPLAAEKVTALAASFVKGLRTPQRTAASASSLSTIGNQQQNLRTAINSEGVDVIS